MEPSFDPPAAHVQAFVEELLDTGDTLIGLIESLAAGVVANGAMGEEARGELVAMLIGTVAVRLASVPKGDFVRATELLELTVDAVLGDLQRALAFAKQRERAHGARTRRGRRRC